MFVVEYALDDDAVCVSFRLSTRRQQRTWDNTSARKAIKLGQLVSQTPARSTPHS